MPLDQRLHSLANPPQQRRVRPRRLPDKMQQRLVLGRHPRRRRHRRLFVHHGYENPVPGERIKRLD